jgi:hypothetical protein
VAPSVCRGASRLAPCDKSSRKAPRRPPSALSLNQPYPLPSDSNPKKFPFRRKCRLRNRFFQAGARGRHPPSPTDEPSRVEPRLSPLFLPKSQYLSCQRCCAIAAFANSFLPVVCHLWELRRNKKSFSGKQDAAGRGKKTQSSSRGRHVCFLLQSVFLFLESVFRLSFR